MSVTLGLGLVKNLQALYKGYQTDQSNILKSTERAQRIAQVTATEGISTLYYKVSIRPNRDMIRQGQRLNDMLFEERDLANILREQFYYKFDQELAERKKAKGEEFKKPCCNPRWKLVFSRPTSTRWWHLMTTCVPVLLFATFGKQLIKDFGYEVFLIVGSVSAFNLGIIILQMLNGYSDHVCNSEYVYDLAIQRMADKNEQYEQLLGPDAAIDPDDYHFDHQLDSGSPRPVSMGSSEMLDGASDEGQPEHEANSEGASDVEVVTQMIDTGRD